MSDRGCECCDSEDALCDGCGCCEDCCNCTESDCDCDVCTDRRAEAISHIVTPADVIAEFRKGCGNTIGGRPEDCPDCLAFATHILMKRGFTEVQATSALKGRVQ